LLDQRIGIAEVSRYLKQPRQVAHRQVHRPIGVRRALLGTLNCASGPDLIFADIPTSDKPAELVE
jgi:hypothetical protein